MGLTDALAAARAAALAGSGALGVAQAASYIYAKSILADPVFRKALTEDLSEALMWHLDADPCEHVTWGTNESLNQLAEAVVGCCLLEDE